MTTKLTLHGEIVELESVSTPLPPELIERKRITEFFKRHRAGTGGQKTVSTNITSKGEKVTILIQMADGTVAMEEAHFLDLVDCADLSITP